MNPADNLKAGSYTTRLGKSGTVISSGIISQEEYNHRLTGRQALQQYDIMRRSDSTVQSLLRACRLPITQADWFISPASEDAKDVKIAEDMRKELFNRNVQFRDFLRQAINGMYAFGHSVFELTLDFGEAGSGYKWGIAELGFRKQTSILRWQTEDGQAGITQQLIGEANVSIPMEKLVPFVFDKEGDNYEGISMLRYVYKDWDIKDKLGLILAIALEKAGIPTPVITAPSAAAEGEKDQAILDIQQLRSNEKAYLMKQAGWEVDVLDMSGQSTDQILPYMRYLDRQIVRSMLAQFLELGSEGSSGSYSLSTDMSALFEKSLEAVAYNVQETIQKHIIDKLCALNYSSLPNGTPKLHFGKFSQDDIQKTADAVSKLTQAGVVTVDFDVENSARKTIGMPELPEEMRKEYTPPVIAKNAATDPAAVAQVDADGNPIAAAAPVNLNGTQVVSLIEVITKVATKEIPRETGIAIMIASFNMDAATASNIMGPVGNTFFVEEDPLQEPQQTQQKVDVKASIHKARETREELIDILVRE